jgi:DNA-binding MarR family transcriptional regulator
VAKTTRTEILDRLQRAQRLQGAQSTIHGAAIAAKVGINPVDLECLDLLQIYGPLPAGQLAARAGLRTATITTILDRLEKSAFIRRDRSGVDRRVVLIHLQPKALQAIGPHYRHLMTRLSAVEAKFTVDELALIARFTEQAAAAVSAAVEDLRDPPPEPR